MRNITRNITKNIMRDITRNIMVMGTGTDIGKTYLSQLILQQAQTQNWNLKALKPVLTGFTKDHMLESDPALLLKAMGQTPSLSSIKALSPFSYEAPLAPSMASRNKKDNHNEKSERESKGESKSERERESRSESKAENRGKGENESRGECEEERERESKGECEGERERESRGERERKSKSERKGECALSYHALIDFCKNKMAEHKTCPTLIETIGGVATPLTSRHTNLDWAQELGVPVLLIGGVYLGCLSHIITALTALKAHNIKPLFVVLNEMAYGNKQSAPIGDLIYELKGHFDIPYFALPIKAPSLPPKLTSYLSTYFNS